MLNSLSLTYSAIDFPPLVLCIIIVHIILAIRGLVHAFHQVRGQIVNRLIMGPEQPILNHIKDAASRHSGGQARIAVAWAREEGVCWLLDAVQNRISDMHVVVGVNDRGTTVEALLRLLQSPSRVSIFYKHFAQTFHPKIYWFSGGEAGSESSTLIVGSSNITHGGLLSNFEASIVVEVVANASLDEKAFLSSAQSTWDTLLAPPYSHAVENADYVRKLYESRYLICEHDVRRERRRSGRKEQPLGDLPTSPPERFRATFPPIAVPFPLGRETLGDAVPDNTDPEGSTPLPDRFFIRTLTANDVMKLNGMRPGTFEPDLGETARDRYPAFWGWPDMYTRVTRRLSRLERQVDARLFSSVTSVGGTAINITLWYREARTEHAPEHRFRPGPIGVVRQAVPPMFDTTSLMVVEQAPSNAGYGYIVRFITAADAGYLDFSTYLTEQRPKHRFGYGP